MNRQNIQSDEERPNKRLQKQENKEKKQDKPKIKVSPKKAPVAH